MQPLIKHFAMSDFFEPRAFGSDAAHKLTKADVIRLCMESAGETASRCVMIGDSISDGTSAQQLDVDFIGVEYGFGIKNAADTFGCPNAIGSAVSTVEIEGIILNKKCGYPF